MTARPLTDIVVCDANILGGTPVFAGTRVPVDTLLAHLKAGDTIDTFLDDFPSVSRAQAEAAIWTLAADIAVCAGTAGDDVVLDDLAGRRQIFHCGDDPIVQHRPA